MGYSFTNGFISLALLFSTVSVYSIPVVIKQNGSHYQIDPETLAVECLRFGGDAVVLSDPTSESYEVETLFQKDESVSWTVKDQGVDVRCTIADNGAFELTATATTSDATFPWPVRVIDSKEQLILARNSGLLLSPINPFWRQELLNAEWDTLETMSMPVWGVLDGGQCVSWMTSSPFRNTFSFSEGSEGLALSFKHHFHPKSPERTITYRVTVDQKASPITPGLRYREWLDESDSVTMLAEKAKAVPNVERLLGAPHVYLWGESPFTWMDIPRQNWNKFAVALVAQSEKESSVGAQLKKHFNEEQWDLVVQCTTEEWPHKYMKSQIAEGISTALKSPEFHSKSDNLPKRVQENALVLEEAFPGLLLPSKQWGNGDSLKMMDKLKKQGFEYLKLCFAGWESVEMRPWVATEADQNGWLMGTYDSYHSIHDPALAGTDNSWSTAQMTPELWGNGGVMNEDGSYKKGFKGKGKKLSPIFGRSYYEERVTSVIDAIPFNYYFIDCDAYGEVYDDYNPLHLCSMEQDAEERTDRLGWLSREKGLVVGSEGGNVYAIESIHVLEGLFGPYFGWGDEDMANKESEYYRGRYYPADEPEIQFKPVPLKEQYRQMHYDPSVRIPLFQAAFHDAVVSTHHWSNDRFKYPEVTKTVSLLEILYMCPPMVNLNLTSMKKRGPDLKKHYDVWSPLHRELGFAKLTGFRYLDENRLVQETTWENGKKIVVNFGEVDFTEGDVVVKAGEVMVE